MHAASVGPPPIFQEVCRAIRLALDSDEVIVRLGLTCLGAGVNKRVIQWYRTTFFHTSQMDKLLFQLSILDRRQGVTVLYSPHKRRKR